MRSPLAFIEIIRPVNSIMNGVAVIVGYIIACGCLHVDVRLIWGFLVGFFLTASSMVINDYFDRFIDEINAPSRPIPSGRISVREAKIYGAFLGFTGLTIALYLGVWFFIIALVSYMISLLYNWRMKRTGFLGNLMVSYCVAIPFIYGSLLLSSKSTLIALIFAFIAFLANTGREITKGMVDVPGDRERGVETIAVKYGLKKAAIIASAFYIVAVILSFIPLYLGLVNNMYIPFIIITDIGFLWSSLKILRNPSRDEAYIVKKRILLFMLLGMIAFTLGRLPLDIITF